MSDQPKPEPIKIDRGPWREALVFNSPDDAEAFFKGEKEGWDWVRQPLGGGNVESNARRHIGLAENLASAVDAWKNGTKGPLESQLQKWLGARRVLVWDDFEATAIRDLAIKSPTAAAVALAIVEGRDDDIDPGKLQRDDNYRVGRARGLALLAGVDPALPASAAKALQRAQQLFAEDANKLREQIAELTRSSSGTLAKINEDADTLSSDLNRQGVA
jgi:hypothetical protein